MFLARIKTFIFILFFAVSLTGCYLIRKDSDKIVRPPLVNQTESDSSLLESIEEEYAYIELENLSDQESKWSDLSDAEKLDSTEALLDIAESRQNIGDFTSSAFYLHTALEIIYDIDENNAELDTSRYAELKEKAELRYKSFLSGVDILPEESSSEDVFTGISLVEADTTNGESDIFEKPELMIEESEIDSVLSLTITFPEIPIVRNQKVENVIKFFQGKGRKVFTKWLERSEYAVPGMTKILREQGLPEELVYLSMIESGFNTKAYSYAHAAGPWQFISSTARIFSLKVDWWYDERRHPDKATIAACKYLKKLYLDFDDWYLALAAYNCGEGRVKRHVAKYHTRDFWQLKKLPKQTKNYVPTFLAALIIAQNPEQYGFESPVHKNLPPVDSVLVTECIDLNAIAEIVSINYDEIKELNPEIVRWCTPPTRDSVWIRIPVGKTEAFYAGVVNIPESQKRSWIRHQVRTGETLSIIARKYGVSMQAIMDIKSNNIHSKHNISAGKYLLIPVPPYKYSKSMAGSFPSEPMEDYVPEGRQKIVYVVRAGDNLSTIADKYHTTAEAIKQWNRLSGKRFIYPGQKLSIYVRENSEPAQTFTPNLKVTANGKVHVVRNGESLWSIALTYNLDISQLKALNGLNNRSVIHPGDELKLYENEHASADTAVAVAATATVKIDSISVDTLWNMQDVGSDEEIDTIDIVERSHIVKRGENLWLIAKKYNLDVEKLKRFNGFTGRSPTIVPGDRIRLYSEGEEIPQEQKLVYTVKSGDTLWAIASAYGVDLNDLKKYNDLTGKSIIRPGDKLVIPVGN